MPLLFFLFSPPFTNYYYVFFTNSPKTLTYTPRYPFFNNTHISFCSKKDSFQGFSATQWPNIEANEVFHDNEELGLLGKPTKPENSSNNESFLDNERKVIKPDEDEALRPFLKFFKPRDQLEVFSRVEKSVSDKEKEFEGKEKVNVECYDPKPGDFVMGVVVSGNENRLDVNIGADYLATMLTKEVLPLYGKEMDYLLCDTEKDSEDFMVFGKMGIVKNEEAVSCDIGQGKPVVDSGTVLFAKCWEG